MNRPNKKSKLIDNVSHVLAEMRYLERIGRNPYNASEPMPKYSKYCNTLYNRKKRKDCMGNRLYNKAPF